MSKIKFNLTLKKIKFSVSFMFLFAIIMLLLTRQLSRQKATIFHSHFASISSCSACLVGKIWTKFYTKKMSLNTILTIRNRRSKLAQNVEVGMTLRAEKTLRQRNK